MTVFNRPQTIFSIPIPTDSKQDILEKIKKNIAAPQRFFHIVSLNPEILVLAKHSESFRDIVTSAQIRIIDGIGVRMAAKVLGIASGPKVSGVDLMMELLDLAGRMRLRVVLIGGKQKVADAVAKCYSSKYPEARFFGLEGIKDIQKPQKSENEAIFSIVTAVRPHLLFVSFGSPWQEQWIWEHKKELSDTVCMGVGGSFDFVAGTVPRAPAVIRAIGLEWLFRLLYQPWRWRRQLKLLEFVKDICVLLGGYRPVSS